ncbi:MAG: LysR family transcriptional regulator, partial [Pseudomonadota bacterium]
MTYRFPSLNGLKAFEASARHLSFKAAAGELGVTPGAVSQQVKRLEASLGI